jgi:predicted RNA-binding protein with RPS1 domain
MRKEIVTYTIKFPSKKALSEAIEKDILQGGIYVASSVLPALNQNVKLKLFVEDIKQPIELYGRVVRVVDEETSRRTKEKIGFAVHFENMSEEFKNELLKIVKGFEDRKLKIHGRRRSPRRRVNIPVEVIYKGTPFEGKIAEISLYGAYVSIKGMMVEEGEKVEVIFKGNGFKGERTKAKVVYYFSQEKASSFGKEEGMGIEFEELNENLYLLIYSLFENQK